MQYSKSWNIRGHVHVLELKDFELLDVEIIVHEIPEILEERLYSMKQ